MIFSQILLIALLQYICSLIYHIVQQSFGIRQDFSYKLTKISEQGLIIKKTVFVMLLKIKSHLIHLKL